MSDELLQGKWYTHLLSRALEETQDLGEAILAADLALSMQPLPENGVLPKDLGPTVNHFTVEGGFAFDIFNRTAQGILNDVVRQSEEMTAEARRDLSAALEITNPVEQGRRIVDLIADYRLQLADLLTATQLAALLEGAREVARQVPVVSPIRGEGRLPPPLISDDERLRFPLIEEAAHELASKNLVTRELYDQLDAAARAKAFAVAGVDAQDTLAKIRDTMVENVQEGVDYATWKKEIMAAVDEGTFLSDAHNEVVFRTNIQAAFSDGQMGILKHPVVRRGFPYASYDAIHDDRVREEHLALESHGIAGSNVYRIDDPVFRIFRPPWDYNDRCSWIPMTIRQAAEAGIPEAKEWLETGVEPTPPAFVPMPPFQPPPGFRRETLPMSIQMSLLPLEGIFEGIPEPETPKAFRIKKRRETPLEAGFANWQPFRGGTGRTGWKDMQTGEIRYQISKPGSRRGAQKQPGAERTITQQINEAWNRIPADKKPADVNAWKQQMMAKLQAGATQETGAAQVPPSKLTRAQKTSIAAGLATSSLQAVMARMKNAGIFTPEEIQDAESFATSIDRFYKKRDGFTPKAVIDIINRAEAPKATPAVGAAEKPAAQPQPSPPDPLQGHPLKGKTKEQSLAMLQSVNGNQGREKADQWQEVLKNTVVPNEAQSAELIRQAVRQYVKDRPYANMPLNEVAAMVPDLNAVQVQAMAVRMAAQGIIRPFAWTSSLAQLPSEAIPYVYPAGDELKFYLHPGPDPTSSYTPKNPQPMMEQQQKAAPTAAPAPQPTAQGGNAVNHKFSKELEDDIEYLIDNSGGEKDRASAIQEIIQDSDDKEHWSNAYKKELIDFQIKYGILRPVSEEELQRTQTTSGKKYDVKVKGQPYVFDSWKPLEQQQPAARQTGPLSDEQMQSEIARRIEEIGGADLIAIQDWFPGVPHEKVNEAVRAVRRAHPEWRLTPVGDMRDFTKEEHARLGEGYAGQAPYAYLSKPEHTGHFRTRPKALATEAYGTDPPGPGWQSAGEGKWIKPKPKSPAGPKIAIVGGGPGGLFAAYILSQKLPKAHVTIFEASQRVGGKMLTDHFSDGTPFEAGVAELYEYLGPGDRDPMRQLIEEDLALPTVDMRGGGVILDGKLLRSMEDLEKEYGYDTFKRVQQFHRKMTELMPLDKYAHRWQPDNKHPWAKKTFLECLEEEIPDDETARCYICAACHSDLATEPYSCNGLNGIKNVLMDNDEYMQLYHVVGGIERIASALGERISATATIRYASRVTGIRQEDDYIVDGREDNASFSESFDAVILALPNHWLTQLEFDCPGLKDAIKEALEHYDAPAHYFRVSILFRRNWWEQHKIPGDFWMMDCANGCCCYNESFRWRSHQGHVLSWLMAGQDALLQCAANESDEEIVNRLLDCLPEFMREDAKREIVEAQVDRYVGSINAQPGSFPVKELEAEHHPEPKECPGVFLIGDFFFDSTLNAALFSAGVAVDLLIKHLGVKSQPGTAALQSLEPTGPTL